VFGGFGDGVGDLGACGPEEHQFVGQVVHHVEKGFHPHSRIALKQTETNAIVAITRNGFIN